MQCSRFYIKKDTAYNGKDLIKMDNPSFVDVSIVMFVDFFKALEIR